ncbi:MAG: hypothetical protein ACE5GE_03220 [Phycisphaerae bacterium]
MTKKKKTIYGLMLGVGLLALLVDRLMTTRPAQASAAASSAPTLPGATANDPKANPTELESVAAAPFPRVSADGSTLPPIRDAFTLLPAAVEALGGQGQTGTRGPNAQSNNPSEPSAAEFAAKHELSAVLEAGGFGVAVVDGQWVRVGDVLDACKLVEITGRQAIFECFDESAELAVRLLEDESYAP